MNLSFSLSENPCPSSCCLHFDSTFNSICLLVPFVSEDLVMKTCYFSDKLCVVGWKFSDLIVYFLSSSSLSSLSVWLERKRARKKILDYVVFGFPNIEKLVSVKPNHCIRLNWGCCFWFIGLWFLGSQMARNPNLKNPPSFIFLHFPSNQTHLNITLSLIFLLLLNPFLGFFFFFLFFSFPDNSHT